MTDLSKTLVASATPSWSAMDATNTAAELAFTAVTSTLIPSATISGSGTLSPTQTTTATPQQSGDEQNGKCELLGPFAILVQAALGGLALLALVYKRWRERPQRQVKVWAFDVSKQVFGSLLLHLANLLASMFSAGQIPVTASYHPNPCSYYLLNLGIDTTLGIPILILILRVLNYAALYTPLASPPESIESGNYGRPPNIVWWFKQTLIYFVGLVGMKTCVFFIIHLLPFIVKIGDWALRWTEGNTAVQIFFVMLLFPVIMNAIQYYIIDVFIKKPIPDNDDLSDGHSFDTASIDNDRHHRSALLAGMDEDDEDADSLEDHDRDAQLGLSDDEAVNKHSVESGRRVSNTGNR